MSDGKPFLQFETWWGTALFVMWAIAVNEGVRWLFAHVRIGVDP